MYKILYSKTVACVLSSAENAAVLCPPTFSPDLDVASGVLGLLSVSPTIGVGGSTE